MTLVLFPKEGEVNLKLINPNQQKEEVNKAIQKREKLKEGDFSFWHYPTDLTQSDESFDLVNQFDFMVAQFGFPSMPTRDIVDI